MIPTRERHSQVRPARSSNPSAGHHLLFVVVSILAGPFTAGAVLLALGGALKARNPAPAVGALRGLGLPTWAPLVRVLAAVELGVGMAALALDSRVTAGAVAISYLAFAGFALLALRRGAMISSCGCFGRADAPPTASHVVINLAAGAVAAGVAADPSGTSFASAVADQPLFGIPFTFLCLTCAWFAYLAFTRLAQLNGLRTRP